MSKYLLIVALVVTSGVFVKAQSSQKNGISKDFRSPFRYAVVSNKFDSAISRKDENRRFVEVLLDSKSFSKENLIVLLKLISNRYPKPNLLYVNVFTNLEDVETPEEREKSRLSESRNESSAPNLSDSAVFIRSRQKSFFYIYFADGDFDEVEIK